MCVAPPTRCYKGKSIYDLNTSNAAWTLGAGRSEVSSIRTRERSLRHGTPIPVLLSEFRLSHSSCLSFLVSSCSGARGKSYLKKDLTKRCSQPLAAPMHSFYMTYTLPSQAAPALASGG